MSYDLKLLRKCTHRIFWEEQVTEPDGVTLILNKPLANNDVLVRVNGYPVEANNTIEMNIILDITSKFDGTNNVFIIDDYLYTGQNLDVKTTNPLDITIQIYEEEDVSSQITGAENFFVTSHKPLLTEYNFSKNISTNSVKVEVNAIPVSVVDVNGTTGRIQTGIYPLATDTVIVKYFYQAHVENINGETGIIRISEIPDGIQQVQIKYFSKQRHGWNIVSKDNKKIILFDQVKKTNRGFVSSEDVSAQFTGTETKCFVSYIPLLPFEGNLNTTSEETLVNSVGLFINGERAIPSSINVFTGEIILPYAPSNTDTITISYYYKKDVIPDTIIVDYTTALASCPKCNGINVYDDLEYDQTGNLRIVRNEDKLIQDIRKIVVTIKGTNAEHLWYGTTFESMIGESLLPDFVRATLASEIQIAGQNMKSLQVQQEQYQEVTDREFINFLDNIDIKQNSYEPSMWHVSVSVVNQSGEPVQLEEEILFDSPLFISNLSLLSDKIIQII